MNHDTLFSGINAKFELNFRPYWKFVLILIPMLIAGNIASPLVAVNCLVVAVWGVTSFERSLKALLLISLLMQACPFGSTPPILLIFRFIYPLVVLCHAFLFTQKNKIDLPSDAKRIFILFTIFFIYAIVVLFFRDNGMIGIMKLVQFSYIVLTLYYSFLIIPTPFEHWTRWLSSIWIAVLLASTIFPQVSEAGTFRGVLDYPQLFGPFCIVGLAILWTHFLKSNSVLETCFFILSAVLCLAAGARTAFAGFFLIQLTLLIWLLLKSIFLKNKPVVFSVKREVISKYFFVVLALIVIITVNKDALYTYSVQKIMKYDDGHSSVSLDDGLKSREGQIEGFKDSIMTYPFLGVGFGLPFHGVDIGYIQYFPNTSIPISATVESGVIVLAAIAQLGIIGTFLFCAFLFQLLKPVFGFSNNVEYIILGTAFIFTNFGEATLFSPTVLAGMSTWFCLCLCATNIQRKRSKTF